MTEAQRPIAIVADDEPSIRHLLTRMLQGHGFDVVEAENGREALEAAERAPPSLMVLDARMPLLDGYDVCARARQNPALERVPIVMVTGYDETAAVHRAFDAGATDFVSKPVNWPLFGHRLRYVMRNAGLLSALQLSEAANAALLSAIPDRILVVDAQGRIERALSGPDATAATAQTLDDLLPGYVARQARTCVAQVLRDGRHVTHEYAALQASQSMRYFEARFTGMDATRVLILIRDVTASKQAQREIFTLSNFDPVTGLPNRTLFTERCRQSVADSAALGTEIALLHVDLDHFARVNDTLGHEIGDDVLRCIAGRLVHCAQERVPDPASVDVARFGGDEFVVFLRDATAESTAVLLARALIGALTDPFVYREHEFVVTASIGIAASASRDASVQTLLKNAATAAHVAKAGGRNGFRLYAETMSARTARRVDLETQLRHALKNDEYVVYYQPKICARSGALAGAEALLRWQHPERGVVPPGEFVPLAEECGLITELGARVVEKVCAQMAAWRDEGFDVPKIAVNISGEEFRNGNPVALLQGACQRHGVAPAQIEVEITESMLLHDIDEVRRALEQLREIGFSLAVDDFGVGYSSLAYLHTFPLHTLKIDRAFIEQIGVPDDPAPICKAIISLARGLGLHVVAEGVETDVQRRCVSAMGCDLLQGYLFDAPLPAADFAQRMTADAARDARSAISSV